MEAILNKLNQIIETAYGEWRDRIVGNEIPTSNERTIQVYLAYIILKVAEPFEDNGKYHIKVILEKDAGEQQTSKTDGRARCDIMIKATTSQTTTKGYVAAIEMKCLKKKEEGKRNKPMTQMRLSVLQDIENLENYSADLKYEIVYSNDRVYPHPKGSNIKNNIGDGITINDDHVNDLSQNLKHKYLIEWDKKNDSDNHFFLKLKIK